MPLPEHDDFFDDEALSRLGWLFSTGYIIGRLERELGDIKRDYTRTNETRQVYYAVRDMIARAHATLEAVSGPHESEEMPNE